MFKKIITHGGQFHADELLSLAVIRYFTDLDNSVKIIRANKVEEKDLEDPCVLVLDTGGRFQPHLGNLDHHQTESLEASCTLALDLFCDNPGLSHILKKNLFNYVSNVDRGVIVEAGMFTRDLQIPTINGIVKSMNDKEEDNFYKALSLVEVILESYILSATKELNSLLLWEEVIKEGGVALHLSREPLVGWKELAKNDNISFLVTPNSRSEGYSLISRDSNYISIPESKDQIFRHKSGFMAVWPTLNKALSEGKKLVTNLKH